MESNERLRELHKSVEKPKDLQRRSQNKTRSARSNSVQPHRASRGGTFPHQGELGHREMKLKVRKTWGLIVLHFL